MVEYAKLVPLMTAVCEAWHWLRPFVVNVVGALS